MSTQVGRISGPLLKANLLREGVDLAFESDLLYFDTTNHRLGIKTSSPARQLEIAGPFVSTGLIIDNTITIGNIVISSSGDNISTIVGTLNLYALDSITSNSVQGGNIQAIDNKLISSITNQDLELRPNGTGQLSLVNDLHIYAGLHAKGNISFDNNVIFGDDSTQDTIVFNARVDDSLIPTSDITYSIGNSSQRWNNIYLNDLSNYPVLYANDDLVINGTSYGIIQGNIWYVSANGSPTNSGKVAYGAFDTLELALANATSGDSIYIFPGTYNENFPLTVPNGVSVVGIGTESCIIKPTLTTNDKDAFLLNTDSSISNITIEDFYFNTVNNTGYAFKLDTGYNFNKSHPFVSNVIVKTKGSITSPLDPIGYDSGDAGKGIYLDGSVANQSSADVSFKLYNVYFTCPGVESITVTNGVTTDFQNVFIYFASKSYYVKQGLGRTRQASLTSPNNLLLANVLGESFFRCEKISWEQSGYKVGSTLTNATYFSSGTTITSIQGPQTDYGITYYIININTTLLSNLNANTIFSVTGKIFKTVVKAFNSSSYYGEYSAHADGISSSIYLNNYNFYYVGSEKNSSNDKTLISPSLGILETNNGKVYHVSDSQSGVFNVGDGFFVDPINVNTSVNWYSNNNIYSFNATDGLGNFSLIKRTEIHTGNLLLSGNTLDTISGDLNLTANSGKIYLQTDIFAEEDLYISNDFNIKGHFYIGDELTDSIIISPKLDQNIIPDITNTFDLGTTTNKWLDLFVQEADISDIIIKNNSIDVTITNSDLNITTSGTGSVILESIKFNNKIQSSNDIVLSIGSKSVVINGTNALALPTNLSSQILNPVSKGGLIFETDTKFFTGASNARSTLGEVRSSDRLNFIELSPNTQSINFKNNNNTLVSVQPTGLVANALKIDDILFSINGITTTNNNDINLVSSGTGIANFNDTLHLVNNNILNLTNDPLTISHVAGTGYLKFDNLYGIRIPSGNTSERMANPEVGTTRLNIELGIIEVYNGNDWTVATGTNFALSEEIQDLADIYTLILG